MTRKEAEQLMLLAQSKTDWIDRSIDALYLLIRNNEVEFAQAFLDSFMNKLDTQDNVLLTTENNKRLLAAIDSIYSSISSSINSRMISVMLKDINTIIARNSEFYGRMSSMSNKLFKAKADNIQKLIHNRLGVDEDGKLIKEGYMEGLFESKEVRNKLRDYSYRGVLTKSGVEGFRKGLNELIAGEPKKLGAFSKYMRNYAMDLYSEVDAMNGKLYKEDLGLKYFIYNGGLIKTSRDFCIKRNGRVFKVDETKSWENDPDNKAKQPNYDPLINRGGYACRHSIDYISESMAFILRPDLKIADEYKTEYTSKKTSAKVEVHPEAHRKDLKANLDVAKVLADNNYNVQIRPHSEKPGTKNPEYTINGLMSDLKKPSNNKSKNFVSNAVKDAKNKNIKSLVLNFSGSSYSKNDLVKQVTSSVNINRGKHMKELIFINGKEVVTITRQEILSNWDWVNKLP